ncbi:hypothetical protein [Alkaliphilus transvaalensis]|uniref:hypothetical protein n=1 Tax=Alkaliphilus transvaalensis TaxID=114628 RepID=UPI00047DE8D2|nr:hypothetical protein [Alkaliphilus transvaalensis]
MKKVVILLCLFFLLGSVNGCRPNARTIRQLEKVDEMEEFQDYSGFRTEDGRFYFTAMVEGEFNVYSIDIETREVNQLFTQIDQYDSFIPLQGLGAVYVDQEGVLYYKNQGEEIIIDRDISGFNGPNVIVSLNRDRVLYTKGDHQTSDLYLYIFQQGEPQMVVSNISQDAYKDFYFITQWANNIDYFIFDKDVYNAEGQPLFSLEATTTKWAPNDEFIAYIQMPENPDEKSIIIGDWTTYIGDKLVLFNLDTGEEKVILENPDGLIDPIDSIQWNQDSSKVAIIEGEIILIENVLERIDYQQISVYDIKNSEIQKVEDINQNFYEMLFNDYIYSKSLGTKNPLHIIPIDGGKRRSYEEPIILNNRSMFVIRREEIGYLIDGRRLIEITSNGKERQILELPWEPIAMFLEDKHQKLILINRNLEMFLYSTTSRS